MSAIAVLHGWSDTSASFKGLREFLVANGHQASDIHLADYWSMRDDVRIADVARRMDTVIAGMIADKTLTEPFDMIVHSTGGLVAREWIVGRMERGEPVPVKRLIMLAPANFGSSLARLGKSMLGRVIKGWGSWFEIGQEMLNGLELASQYQWDLARRDLLDATGGQAAGPYGPGKTLPFVITGTKPYTEALRQVVNEPGADGTVRVPAANMNVSGYTIDFTHSAGPDTEMTAKPWTWRAGPGVEIPFAVLPDRDHTTITQPASSSGADGETSGRLAALILQALDCTDAGYAAVAASWKSVSDATGALGAGGAVPAFPDVEAEYFHQHMQFITRAIDNAGDPVRDYFVEFFSSAPNSIKDTVAFQGKVLRDCAKNSIDESFLCFYIDRELLLSQFYKAVQAKYTELRVSISAAAPGGNVRYFEKHNSAGYLTIHYADGPTREAMPIDRRLRRNATHLVEMRLPRNLDKEGFHF